MNITRQQPLLPAVLGMSPSFRQPCTVRSPQNAARVLQHRRKSDDLQASNAESPGPGWGFHKSCPSESALQSWVKTTTVG